MLLRHDINLEFYSEHNRKLLQHLVQGMTWSDLCFNETTLVRHEQRE